MQCQKPEQVFLHTCCVLATTAGTWNNIMVFFTYSSNNELMLQAIKLLSSCNA